MKLNPFIKKYERDFDAQTKQTLADIKKVADPIKREKLLHSFGTALTKMYAGGAPVLKPIGDNFADAALGSVKGLTSIKFKEVLKHILTAIFIDGIGNTVRDLRQTRKEQGTLRHARKLYRLRKKAAKLERKTSKEAIFARHTKIFNEAVVAKVKAAPSTIGRHRKPASLQSQPGFVILH
jgi:hypothetical protein